MTLLDGYLKNVDLCEEALSLLKSFQVDNNILKEFQSKKEITINDYKQIEDIIGKDKENLIHEQTVSLAKISLIKSQFN